MKRLIFGFLMICFTIPIMSQEVKTEELTEVVITPMNYKYLNQVDNEEAPIPARLLAKEAANYDVQGNDLYIDEYNFYTVSFYIPEGKLVAVYNPEGEIVRTIERFKNVNVPKAVKTSLRDRFPNWEVVKDVYLVTYNEKDGAVKSYKFKLTNGDKVVRVKMNENGDFL